MKLLFLCTSVEAGRDGVGDYTRRLAEACAGRGHACHILALHDPFVNRFARENSSAVGITRLPAAAAWTEKLAQAQACVAETAPDWLSWQLVPYGFQAKGVIPDEALPFARLGAGRKNHVLLHELWIGLSKGEPLKNRIWGCLQRRALEKFLERIGALVLHTTNPTYQEVLRRRSWPAALLPLFGNIPVVAGPARPAGSPSWVGGIFGTVHPQFSPKPCFDILAAGAEVSRRKLRILGIGRLGEYGEKMFARLSVDYAGRLDASLVGEQTPEEVSRLLQSLDFGIGTHPWALAGKSGAIAAMLDHGLPVVVPREDWTLRRHPASVPSIDPLMIRLSEMPPELMAGRLASRQPPSPRLDRIASTFLTSLENASAGPLLEL